MAEFEEELKERQVAEEAWEGLSGREEEAFWTKKLAIANRGNNDYLAVLRKIQDAKIKGGRESDRDAEAEAKEQERLDDIDLDARIREEQEKRKLKQETAQAGIKAAEDEYKAEVDRINAEYKLGQINAEQQNALLLAVNAKRYQTEQELYQQLLALWVKGGANYQKVLDEMAAADQKNAKIIQKDNELLAEEQKKQWRTIADELTGPFTSALQTVSSGLLDLNNKGQTFSQTMLKAVQQVIQGFMKLIEQIAMAIAKQMVYNSLRLGSAEAKGIPGMVVQALGLTGSGLTKDGNQAAAGTALDESAVALNEAGTALNESAIALNEAAATLSGGSAASGGGGIMSDMEGLAVLAASRGADIPSAARGWDIDAGGIRAIVHPREMVLPADLAEGVRDMVRGGGSQGRPGGNNYGHTYNITASGINPKDTAAAIKAAVRMGHR
jgi:hypothetical protein